MPLRFVLFYSAIFILFVSTSFGEANEVYELNIAKGVQKLNSGDYDAAGISFEEVLKAIPGDIKATLYLGIVRGKQGRYADAEGLLKKVLESGKELPRAHYELGLIAYEKGEYTKAREHFKKAKELSTDINLNKSIDSILADIEFREPAKSYSLTGIMGIQYDNNVIYVPDNIAVERDEKADIRGVFYGKAEWTPINSTTLGYSFYQSIQANLSDFNTQDHELSVKVKFGLSKKASLQGKYSFDYTYIGGDRYSRIHLLSPSIFIEWKKGFSTKLFYEYRAKTFWDTEVSSDSLNRKADNNLIGIKQDITLGKNISFDVLYSYDRNSAKADYWTYNGNQIAGSLNYTDPKWRLDLKADYYDKLYKGLYPTLLVKRHDRTETYTVSVTRSLTQKLLLNLTQVFIRNSSNIGLYDYDRSITSLFLIAMF